MLDVTKRQGTAPFDTAQLDRLMDEAGIDVLLANSKPNVQYLLGGHRSFFFDTMDAIGVSSYLPIVVYAKGAPEKAGYFGHRMEGYQTAHKALSGNVELLKKIAEALLEHETIDGEDIDTVLGGGTITRRPPPPLRPAAEPVKEKRPSIFARPTPVLKEEPEKA